MHARSTVLDWPQALAVSASPERSSSANGEDGKVASRVAERRAESVRIGRVRPSDRLLAMAALEGVAWHRRQTALEKA